MFRLYSKGCEYALRALAHIAPEDLDGRFQAKTLCETADIPESFTRKVFQSLVQAGFLRAVRGPGGGYALVSRPEEISLLRIIHAVDGYDTFASCILGLDECNSKKPCPLHHMWAGIKTELQGQLEQVTLQDLINTVQTRKSGWPKGEPVEAVLASAR